MLAAFGSLSLWSLAVARLSQGKPILERDPHRLAVWGFVDVLMAVVILFVLQFAFAVVAKSAGVMNVGKEERTLDDYFIALMMNAVCTGGAFILSWVYVALRTGATPADLGFRRDRFGRDLLIGAAAFLMLAPLVFGVQVVLVSIMGPTQHPLIVLLEKSPEWRLFIAASLNAVIVAPVVEEYFFRGLWQGWTEALRWPPNGEDILFGRRQLGEAIGAATTDVEAKVVLADPSNPYMATLVDEQPPVEVLSDPTTQRTVWWPILLSATLFSLAHINHGPDWVALLVLAIGLGYVYQRTRSLTPSIVVHFLLNATSMVMLWAKLFLDR